MVWALLAVALIAVFGSLFGDAVPVGEYVAATAKAVVEVVQDDEDRADELEAYFEDLEEQLEEDRAELEILRGAFWEIDKRYDATLEDYERVYTDLEKFWERSAKSAIALAIAIRAELTPEEWKQIVEARRPEVRRLLDELRAAR
jgi:hypothetical protein